MQATGTNATPSFVGLGQASQALGANPTQQSMAPPQSIPRSGSFGQGGYSNMQAPSLGQDD